MEATLSDLSSKIITMMILLVISYGVLAVVVHKGLVNLMPEKGLRDGAAEAACSAVVYNNYIFCL